MITIDQEKCTACGICGTVCPRHVVVIKETDGNKSARVAEERQDICMACGQCAAVCPTDAVTVAGLPAEGFLPIGPAQTNYDQLRDLFTRRRSTRRYKDKPVEREVLGKIADAAGLAPTGAGRSTTGLVVIDQPDRLAELSGHLFNVYESMAKALTNPIGRFMVRRKAGELNYHMLQNFVMPGMRWYIRWRDQGRGDEILRDCKALFIFHTGRFEPMGHANCAIAAWHAILAAETLGVGACMNDLTPPICNRSPEAREMLGLAEDQEAMVAVTFGYPKFKYQRTIPRHLASLRYLD